MKIEKNKVVSIEYKLTDDDGKVLDTSEGRAPLEYLHGAGSIIPGLESALDGKENGEHLNVKVEPAEAYGERDEALLKTVMRSKFGKDTKIEVGMQFQVQTPQGGRVVRIARVQGDEITVDANHPLAGRALNFDVSVVGVREATDEEKEHGHAHGPGGHHH